MALVKGTTTSNLMSSTSQTHNMSILTGPANALWVVAMGARRNADIDYTIPSSVSVAGTSCTELIQGTARGGLWRSNVWYCERAAAVSSGTVTITYTTGTVFRSIMHATPYTGYDKSDPFGVTSEDQRVNDQSPQDSATTTGRNSELLCLLLGNTWDGGTDANPDSGWTDEDQTILHDTDIVLLHSRTAGAAGVYTAGVDDTGDSNADTDFKFVEINAAPGASLITAATRVSGINPALPGI